MGLDARKQLQIIVAFRKPEKEVGKAEDGEEKEQP
jgi:hypothetical protein